MDAQVNYAMMDGTNLANTVDDQLPKLKAEGFNEEDNTALKAALAELELKEKAQGQAVNAKDKKYRVKDKVIASVVALIQRLKDAARGAYGGDKKKLKQYKSDENISTGASSLSALCEYYVPLAESEITILSKNGFNQTDLDALKLASEQVKTIASESKRALKLQKAATIIRNDAADAVTKLTKKIRRFVKARFSDKPEVMVLFEPIPKGKSGGGSEDESGDNPNGTDTPPSPGK